MTKRKNFTISGDFNDLANTLKSSAPENELMFSYAKFMSARESEYRKLADQAKGKSKADSIAFVKQRQQAINDDVRKFNESFMEKHKGSL